MRRRLHGSYISHELNFTANPLFNRVKFDKIFFTHNLEKECMVGANDASSVHSIPVKTHLF